MLKLLLMLLVAVAALVVVGVLTLAGIGGDSDTDGTGTNPPPTDAGTPAATATAPDEPTAAEILEESAERTSKVSSFHFLLTHENGSTPLPLNLELESAEGDVAVPDRLRAQVDGELSGINVSVDVIGIEDRTWVTNPFTRGWQELPNTDIRDFADPAALIGGLLPAIRDAELTGGASMDGVETHLVTGTIDSGTLEDALGIAAPGRDVSVEVWIGTEDLLPRRVRLIGALSDADSADVVRQVDVSRYDEPVEIMPPE